MRLLFASHSSGLLGAERALLEIVRDAVAEGHDVTVALPGGGPLRGKLTEAGATCVELTARSWMGPRHRVPPLGLLRLWQVHRSVPAALRLIEDVKPEAVVTNSAIIPAAAFAARRLDVPHVWIVHESLGSNPQLRSLLTKRRIVADIHRLSGAVLSISEFVDSQLRAPDGVAAKPLVRLTPIVAPAGEVVLSTRTRGRLRLTLPGFFSREKGQRRAVLALARARRQGADVSLRLVGVGGRLSETSVRLVVAALRLGRSVDFVGWRDSPGEIYAQTDAVLMVSRNEAFGRTTAEALMLGLPVLGLRAGATPELVGPGSRLLVAGESVASLARAMVETASLGAAEWSDVVDKARERGEHLRAGERPFVAVRRALALAGVT